MMNKKQIFEHFEEMFRKEIQPQADKIDPSQEQDWYSLVLGWALGKGMGCRTAHAFSCYIRYHTDLA
jgi:hypothetical protein